MRGLLVLLALMTAGSPLAAQFHGYPCTVDCSGHQAGYAWANDKGIDAPARCSGHSKSFVEGCMAAAEEAAGSNTGEESDQLEGRYEK